MDNSLEIIAEDPKLRAMLSLVPHVGGSLVELFAGKGQQMIEERRDEFIQQLSKRLETVDERAVREDYFETPEGFDLLIKALDEARKTRSTEKRDFYARILAGAASAPSENEEVSAEEYLYLVSDLTIRELKLVRKIYEVQKDYIRRYIDQEGQDPRQKYTGEEIEIWYEQRDILIEDAGVDHNEVMQLVSRISSTGLVDVNYINVPGSTAATYWISPVLEELMRFVGVTD